MGVIVKRNYRYEDLIGHVKRNEYLREMYDSYDSVAAVPKGGMVPAVMVAEDAGLNLIPIEERTPHTLLVDDIIDSGTTRLRYPENDFFALIGKKSVVKALKLPTYASQTYVAHVVRDEKWLWVNFFWENVGDGKMDTCEDNITRILQYIGEDVTRDGLKDTPKRVVKSYEEIFSGYRENISDLFTVFEGDGYDQIILLKNIEFASTCEHHMLPFTGTAHVAYLPGEEGKIVGISKLARIVDVFAKRLQNQERIGQQVIAALNEHLNPQAAACVLEAKHSCMSCRGVNKQGSSMVTSSLSGVFRDDAMARQELFSLIHG